MRTHLDCGRDVKELVTETTAASTNVLADWGLVRSWRILIPHDNMPGLLGFTVLLSAAGFHHSSWQ